PPVEGSPTDERAPRIVPLPAPAIGAVGVGGNRGNARGSRERRRQRQCVFLVGSAAAFAAQRDGEFPAGEDHRAPSLHLEVAGKSCLRGGDVARLALECSTQQDGFVSG